MTKMSLVTSQALTGGYRPYMNGMVRHQDEFIATEGQMVFNLEHAYDQFQNKINVEVGGVPQFSPKNYTESSSISFTLSEGVPEGTEVIATYFSEAQPLSTDLEPLVNGLKDNVNAHNDKISNLENQLKNQQLVSVKDFGAIGNGVTDNREAFQDATDFVVSKGGGVIHIPPGIYLIDGSINIYPGITYQGQPGSIIKKAPLQDKWARTFNSGESFLGWSGAEDSLPINFYDLTIDNNSAAQGPFTNFELEQMACIFLSTKDNSIGKLVVNIDNCQFLNSTGDGVQVYLNVKLNISNCTFRDCFRGSVVVVGGGTTVRANNLLCGGKFYSSFFQSEVEGEDKVEIVLTNSIFNALDNDLSLGTGLDVGVKGNSNVLISNCYFGAGCERISGETSEITINNCVFRLKNNDVAVRFGNLKMNDCLFLIQDGVLNGMTLRSFGASDLRATFDNCHFRFENDPIASAPVIANISNVILDPGGSLIVTTSTPHGIDAPGNYGFTIVVIDGLTPEEYNGAYFVEWVVGNELHLALQKNYGVPSVLNGTVKFVPQTVGVVILQDELSLNNEISIRNCYFDYGFLKSFEIRAGGNLTFENNKVNSFGLGQITSTAGLNSIVTLANNTIMSDCRFWLEMTCSDILTNRVDLTTINQQVPANASFTRIYVSDAGLVLNGNREIYDNDAPNPNMKGYRGDVFTNNSPTSDKPYKYVFHDNQWKVVQSISTHIETVTIDPLSPIVGQTWLRTDL